jgi:hypothetical protein
MLLSRIIHYFSGITHVKRTKNNRYHAEVTLRKTHEKVMAQGIFDLQQWG